MGLNLSGKSGRSIKLITEKLKQKIKTDKMEIGDKRKVKNSYKSGKLDSKDMKDIATGLEMLRKITNETLRVQVDKLLSGEQDVSRARKEFVGYRDIMGDFLRRLSIGAREEYSIQKRIELLSDYSQISQAARDGVILKQAKRQEMIDGELKEVIYDTTMTPKEVIETLMDYERKSEKLQFEKLDNYLGLGLGLAGTIGTMLGTKKEEENEKGTGNLVTLGTMAISGLALIQGVLKQGEEEQKYRLKDEQLRMRDDLLGNEQISSQAEDDTIRNIQEIAEQESKLGNKIENKRLLFNISVDLAIAIISGKYINKQIEIKEDGKIDGKSLAAALMSLKSTKGIAGNFVRSVKGFQNSRKDEAEYQELCKKVKSILSQMEEKIYPLEGAKNSFNSIEIKNLNGRFYPKKNYETGDIEYATTINIPEFSMKRGDVVLLSGESGAGKSTFLRLLKRGDINNRKCIKLDNEQMVDNLGNEYISFRPSINLGDESNVLAQITGKQNISDLNETERQNLFKIMQELKLDFPDLLKQLASKKFMEFSTGEQRRLVLSKLFYRIGNGASVIIVDEPVGNVEDKLIREQLEMIKEYANKKNVMLLLTTHRLDLAKDLATKRYHINQNGVLEQKNVVSKDKEK